MHICAWSTVCVCAVVVCVCVFQWTRYLSLNVLYFKFCRSRLSVYTSTFIRIDIISDLMYCTVEKWQETWDTCTGISIYFAALNYFVFVMFASVSKQQILYKALKRDREFVVACVCVCVFKFRCQPTESSTIQYNTIIYSNTTQFTEQYLSRERFCTSLYKRRIKTVAVDLTCSWHQNILHNLKI